MAGGRLGEEGHSPVVSRCFRLKTAGEIQCPDSVLDEVPDSVLDVIAWLSA